MRRFLTLVILLCLAVPAGISISGCTRNTSANYCNGEGYGLKIDDVSSIKLTPATTGISLAWGQTKQLSSPTAYTCKSSKASVSSYTYGTTNNLLVDVSTSGMLCAGTWNRNTGGGISDYTICTAPSPLPSTNGLPYKTAYVTASASSITSNPVEVYVHAPVTSLSLVGPDKCLSQGVEWGTALDVQACYTSNNKHYLMCAPSSVTSSSTATLACDLPTGVSRSSIPTCPSSIGTLTFTVGTSSVASINSETNMITAELPGTTAITASVAGSGSSAGYFSTCPPASISLSLADGTTSGTITQGVTQSLTTKVVDTNGKTITGLTLEYQSTDPISISATSTGSLSANYPAQASLYAVCQPANCNPSPINKVGIYGTGLPISSDAVTVKVPGTTTEYLWFGAPGESQYFVPVETRTGTVGSAVRLPYVPNSMVMDRTGTSIYFGSAYELMVYSTSGNSLSGVNTAVPGVVLAASPTNSQLLINDRSRKIFYLYNVSGTVVNSFGGVGYAAQWTPDAKTLYVVGEGTNSSSVTVPMLFVYNTNTGWTKYDLSATGASTNLAITVPSVGAFLNGTTTTARTWCPTGTVGSYSTMTFYPQADSIAAQTDVLGATVDGTHILGAAVASSGVTLSDIAVDIPIEECPGAASSLLEGLPLTHTLNTLNVSKISASAVNQVVTSSASNLAFLTYTGSATGAQLPYYVPNSSGTAGTLSYLTLTGSNSITAPVAGAFSPDSKYFFVSTSGDNLVHTITLSTMTDTKQTDVKLPSCTSGGTDSGCTYTGSDSTVAPTVITVKPRATT